MSAPSLSIAPLPFRVTFLDGTIETVHVRPLDVIELYEFIELAAANKTPDLVAAVVKKPKDWLRNLAPKEYGKLAQRCIELNFDRAMELTADPIAAALIWPMVGRVRSAAKILDTIGTESRPSASESARSATSAGTGRESSETHSRS
jgi:hypothetical protein